MTKRKFILTASTPEGKITETLERSEAFVLISNNGEQRQPLHNLGRIELDMGYGNEPRRILVQDESGRAFYPSVPRGSALRVGSHFFMVDELGSLVLEEEPGPEVAPALPPSRTFRLTYFDGRIEEVELGSAQIRGKVYTGRGFAGMETWAAELANVDTIERVPPEQTPAEGNGGTP